MTAMAFATAPQARLLAPQAQAASAARPPTRRHVAAVVSPSSERPWASKSMTVTVCSLIGMGAGGRAKARGSRVRATRRRSAEENAPEPDVAAPVYPGPEDPAKMLDFAKDLIDFYRGGNILPISDLMKLLGDAERLLEELPTLVRYEVPEGGYLNVVGDVHGQLFDFLKILDENGLPSEENPFLFNGDFVDRGSYSVEIMVLLLSFKLALPKSFHLTRGNHEDGGGLNTSYGFTGELLAKYQAQLAVWSGFQRVFWNLPLSYVINGDVFVTHGGLPRQDKGDVPLADIEALDRLAIATGKSKLEEHLLLEDLMWSDPRDVEGTQSGDRGLGCICFGADVTERFLARNSLSFIIRSHEVKEEGFEWQHDKQCLTVFSAPNYCDMMTNKGAVVRLHARAGGEGRLEPEIRPFTSAPEPDEYIGCMAFQSKTRELLALAREQAE